MIFEYQKFLSFSISKDVWCFWIYIYILHVFLNGTENCMV